MSEPQTSKTTLHWEFGTAYELFISLYVLHMPEHFGIRASWAAGIRSRIPAAERRLLEDIGPFMGFPLSWVHSLPAPRDVITALWAIKQMPAGERFTRLTGVDCCKTDWQKTLNGIIQRRAWEQADVDFIQEMAKKAGESDLKEERVTRFLDRLTQPEELGEGFLSALQSFNQAFFEEEEKRLAPILQTGLERARAMSERMGVEELLKELSQGVELGDLAEASELFIIPAYWTTPLILFEPASDGAMLFLFGARPADMAAIPGEMVPDSLLRVMKALADPTRLKILYYLTQEGLSPSELARRLHLRAPTVTHHLSELRLSGLVNLTIKGQEKRYRTRNESLEAMCTNLKGFLHTPHPEG